MEETLSMRLTLLDQQVLDSDGLPVGRADDLVVDVGDDGRAPAITGVLVGAEPLGRRLGGWTGRVMAGVSRRLRPADGEQRTTSLEERAIPLGWFTELDPLELRYSLSDVPGVAGLERWLSAGLVSRIPGGGRAVE